MLLNTIVLNIWILVWLTLTLIQDHRSARKQKLLCQLFHKVFNWFEWNLVYYRDLLVWWTSYSFYLVHSVFKGKNPTCMILYRKKQRQKNFDDGLYSDIYREQTLWFHFLLHFPPDRMKLIASWGNSGWSSWLWLIILMLANHPEVGWSSWHRLIILMLADHPDIGWSFLCWLIILTSADHSYVGWSFWHWLIILMLADHPDIGWSFLCWLIILTSADHSYVGWSFWHRLIILMLADHPDIGWSSWHRLIILMLADHPDVSLKKDWYDKGK